MYELSHPSDLLVTLGLLQRRRHEALSLWQIWPGANFFLANMTRCKFISGKYDQVQIYLWQNSVSIADKWQYLLRTPWTSDYPRALPWSSSRRGCCTAGLVRTCFSKSYNKDLNITNIFWAYKTSSLTQLRNIHPEVLPGLDNPNGEKYITQVGAGSQSWLLWNPTILISSDWFRPFK